MTTFSPYVHAESQRFNHMATRPIPMLAANHLIHALAEALTESGHYEAPDELMAEDAHRVITDGTHDQQRGILQAIQDVAQFEREYSAARDALIKVAMATTLPRAAIADAAGFKNTSRLYQISDQHPDEIDYRTLPVLTPDELAVAAASSTGPSRVVIATIDVPLARRLLDTYVDSRPVNWQKVKQLAYAIKKSQGAFVATDSAWQVGIGSDGRVFKGQHLLHAIVEAGQQIDRVAVTVAVRPAGKGKG